MNSEDSVTDWIASLKANESRGADHLYHRYVERLQRLVRRRLSAAARRVADEEDIAHIVLATAFDGIVRNRFHRVSDRDDLWQILLMLTDRKIADQLRRQGSLKRGAGHVRGESAFDRTSDAGTGVRGIEHIVDRDPTPEFAAQFSEELEQRLRQLENEELQRMFQPYSSVSCLVPTS